MDENLQFKKLEELLTNDDVPVLLIGYNRPDFLKDRVDELRKMPIKHLYISIDGGVVSNTAEMMNAIEYAKNLSGDLATFNLDHYEENLGLVKHIHGAVTKVLDKFNYVIIVEDDISLSTNFYTNMVNGFNLQRFQGINGIIGGFSSINIQKLKIIRNKWRKSKYCSIWGWGCTREIWMLYSYNLQGVNFKSSLANSKTWKKLSYFQQSLWINRFIKAQNNPFSTWDIQLQYWSFLNSFENLYPVSSMVSNVGFNDFRSEHTKGLKPKWLSSKQGDNRLISISKLSTLAIKPMCFIDANTVAGDSKFNAWWNK
jgi:hypothetical protein